MSAQLASLLQDALGAQYRLKRELAAGGMSRLFLATDVRLQRDVVVKVLPPDLVSAASTARFKREIELTVRLQHPHILPILTSGEWEDGLYYITPYIHGESLRERIERDGKLPLDDILKILKDVSGALAFAHQRGIVHRDIKPGNILLSDGHAILADFGIARAVSATATPLTESGVAPGTPAYMAPELPTDERADVYALGVVAYEMLTGELPRPGTSPKTIRVHRGRSGTDKRSLAVSISRIVVKALARDPAERYHTAIQLRDELSGSSRRPLRAIPLAVAILVSVLVGARTYANREANSPGSGRIALFVTRQDSTDDTLTRQRLWSALEEWDGAQPTYVAAGPQLAPRDTRPTDPSILFHAAAAVHAREIADVSIVRDGDSAIVNVVVYDAHSQRWLRQASERVPVRPNGGDWLTSYRRVANHVLRDGAELPWDYAGRAIRPSLRAWRAYDSGTVALASWDLAAASRFFGQSLSADSDVTPAALGLSEALQWLEGPNDTPTARAAARRAIRSSRLPLRDSLRAAATLAMADGQFVVACSVYRREIELDSTDWSAWLGEGDCNQRDRLVLRDRSSPSGWAFRASHFGAQQAYRKAAQTRPTNSPAFSGWLVGRLSKVVYPRSEKRRLGFAVDRDTLRFEAAARLHNDTLAFTPFPLGRTPPASVGDADERFAAVRLSRELLRQAAERWVALAPTAAAALDSLGAFTEAAERESLVAGRSMSALEIVSRARALAADSMEQLRLAIAETRLRLKAGQFDNARIEADSILRVASESHPGFDGLAGLAGLIGRRTRAAQLSTKTASTLQLMTAAGSLISPPAAIADVGLALMTFSSLECSTDTIQRYVEQFERLLPSYVINEYERAEIRRALLTPAITLRFPRDSALSLDPRIPDDAYLSAQRALIRRDKGARALAIAAIRSRSAGFLPGAIAIDHTVRQVELRLALGDSSAAVEQLDGVLLAMPTLGPHLLSQVEQAGSLVRAMEIRAVLGAHKGDWTTAAHWASAVVALRSQADPDFASDLERFRAIATHGRE